jgi:hypothetical protein
MHIHCRVALLIVGWLLVAGGEATAQMFGPRPEGGSISRGMRPSLTTSPATAPDAATGAASTPGLQTARFLRRNRSAQAFVGADTQETTQHFVGSQDAGDAAMVQAAVSDPRSRWAAAAANRQLQAATATPALQTTMYPPRLQVSFSYSAPSAQDLAPVLSQRLAACPECHAIGPIEVSLAGRTAIVRGQVASERDRFLAQQLLLFEPGISSVRNELTVQSPASNRATRRATSAATETPAP